MRKIAILPNEGKDVGLVNTRQLIEYLSGKAKLYMPTEYKAAGDDVIYSDNLYKEVDTAIVLGGDGTIIQCATDCAKNNIEVLGINLGTIGFMTEVEVENMTEALDKLLSGDYTVEERMLLKAEILRRDNSIAAYHALNDIVFSKTVGEKLINLELYTDGELVHRYVADGLIIATPTGSTGYSISAGGPVVDPTMQLYIATPICAHMLSVRSAILSSEKNIEIQFQNSTSEQNAVVTADGDVCGYISGADKVRITKSKYAFRLIKTGSQSFYETLLSKLS